MRGPLGATLRRGKGSPQSRAVRWSRRLGSLYTGAIAVIAVAAGVAALTESIGGSIEPGVVADDAGGRVRSVRPGSFPWRNGIRPGQTVVSISAADDPGGWHLETEDEGIVRRSSASGAEAALRSSAPLGLAAAALGVLSVVTIPLRRRRAELAAAMALGFAAVPLYLRDDPILSPVVGGLALAAAAAWLIRWGDLARPMRIAVAGGAGALAAAWTVGRLINHPIVATVDGVWVAATIGLAAAATITGAAGMASRGRADLVGVRLVDAVAVAAVVVLAAALQLVVAAPLPVTLGIALGFGVAYARARGALGRWLDHLLLYELRARAAIEAAEQERARMARDLHDDPLQTLTGVIRELERRPETSAQRDALRAVAEHLRGVATELHPPVLEDLGLVPAIEFLLAGTPSNVRVLVDVANLAGYARASRPPGPIELAIFRIIQEAATNALRHAGCSQLIVRGHVDHDDIELDVTDDGRGLPRSVVEEAIRAGRLGIASMRSRAEAIDASVVHGSGPGGGTVVSIRWKG